MPVPSAVTFSSGVLKTPYLGSFLGINAISKRGGLFSKGTPKNRDELVIGWGLKANTSAARHYAESNHLHYLTLEDGFLRSVALGVEKSPPLAVVIDDLGIYYDATRPSRLEKILNGEFGEIPSVPPFDHLRRCLDDYQSPLENEALITRAQQCIKRIVDNRLSKYNSSPDITLETTDKPRILVVDQTAGDLSIQHGMADPASFTQMLNAALAEHPGAEILIKVHPDVIAGKKQGHLLHAGRKARVRLLTESCNPISLLQQVDHVYVVTSQLGFEALLMKKPVTCFGAPFYAGWGVTDDRLETPRRSQQRSTEQLFAAAYILYSRYRDPDTGAPCEIETVINHLAQQRRYFTENSSALCCYGFAPWKRGYVRAYLRAPWRSVHFASNARQLKRQLAQKNAQLVVWGHRESNAIRALAKSYNAPIWRMEDGFFRSVGLGSNLIAPASLVLDKTGIYFDPSQPSDLESILQQQQFSANDLSRAERLRSTIIATGLSKYNFTQQRPLEHHAAPGQTVILVPGQVEDDASIRLGCFDIRTNIDLLKSVRASHADAYIIYKPHPDVVSGNRKGRWKIDAQTAANCDQIVTNASIASCLDVADEIHTMTSLVGFEALLRKKRVMTYGIPFYAGWGLTEDRHTTPRRTRALELNQLVAGTLIHYPRYLNLSTGAFSHAEWAITQLQMTLQKTENLRIRPPRLIQQLAKLKHFVQGLLFR